MAGSAHIRPLSRSWADYSLPRFPPFHRSLSGFLSIFPRFLEPGKFNSRGIKVSLLVIYHGEISSTCLSFSSSFSFSSPRLEKTWQQITRDFIIIYCPTVIYFRFIFQYFLLSQYLYRYTVDTPVIQVYCWPTSYLGILLTTKYPGLWLTDSIKLF